MSIQRYKKNTNFLKIKNIFSLFFQAINRCTSFGRPKVFFRYRTEFTHPSFRRFYQNPPLRWANAHDYQLAHWINYPAWINHKPFIIEINDHPLSAVTYRNRGMIQPAEIINNIQDAKDVYMNDDCKKILVPDNGIGSLFLTYFGDNFSEKITIVNCPGCIPKLSHPQKFNNVEYGVACLASDFELKGVDLLLKAWFSITHKKGWKLYLACPNIPRRVLIDIENDSSIVLFNKAPLSESEKDKILQNCSITVAPTHIHGGANIIEGMEYGHAIVHFTTHSSSCDCVGEKVEVPYHFYSPQYYGVRWETITDFKSFLKRDKQDGRFNSVVMDLANTLSSLINDPDKLISMRKISLSAAVGPLSLAERNRLLKAMYLEIVGIN
jgi:hypothetical protein